MYVFFDLDGTLTDPKEAITACIKYALSKLEQLTSTDGGNAVGLLGTIPALHLRTILAKRRCAENLHTVA